MSDFDRQRAVMVESQVRPNQVTDARLLAAMRALPRFLLAPMVLARLLQLAAVEPQDAVLDVGCATGYSTAVLASLGRSVTGLEPEPELASAARRTLRAFGLENVEIVEGALARGHKRGGPYDVILLNGSVA